ncbi:MAG: aminotransferase class III-fold pyridoxal phosphate-dependent enzyme [Mariniblastus sp.]|nr:aminotransferase class III-fold pyridoxal phosphate-dependent enzyme [Mariniblastus sp.]
MSNHNETSTFAQQLRSDPRLAEAKQLILDAVADHQRNIVNVRPASPALEADYQQMLDGFGEIRGGKLYFPYLSSGLGNGPFVELADGSVKLDMITGIGVHGYGHSHPRLVEAGIDAALSDTVMQGNLQQGPESFELVKLLTQKANETGGHLAHCFLSTSGAMANENSLKIAFQKNQPANRVVAFSHCFAGRTLALSQVTDKPGNRVGLPDTIAVDYIPFFKSSDPAGSTALAVNHLRWQIKRHPGKIAALWMELIQGEGGYYAGSPEFFKALCAVAKENNIAVIADEVQTFGRTSRLYAFQHFGLDQYVDLVTIGKISQVCATLYTDEYKPKPGLISQTFTGSSWAIIAANAIIQGLIDQGHYGVDGRNQKLHAYFQAGLEGIAKRHPEAVSGPYGVGGMVAFTPFEGELNQSKEMVNRMYHAGLMSFIAGSDPVRIRFLMPLGSVEERHIDLACQIIEQIVEEMSSEA